MVSRTMEYQRAVKINELLLHTSEQTNHWGEKKQVIKGQTLWSHIQVKTTKLHIDS